jgi:hypothetical protein
MPCSFAFETQRTFVTLHLKLPMPQKMPQFNEGIGENMYGVFGVKKVQCLVRGELK